MERKIRINKRQSIVGCLYDDHNNLKDKGEFEVLGNNGRQMQIKHKGNGKIYNTDKKQFDMGEPEPRRIPCNNKSHKTQTEQKIEEAIKKAQEKAKRKEIENSIKEQLEKAEQKFKESIENSGKQAVKIPDCTTIATYGTEDKIIALINSGIKNLWMVGPAGSGKTTIAKLVADRMNKPFLLVSCGEGTAPSEFVGRRFPKKEITPFIDHITKPGIIVIDEFPALSPETAQMLNAALANDYIFTTVGKRYRNKDCVIIATSNTFGTGADAMYVANNQLDASTRDRFVGGFIKVDYSDKYERENFDREVVNHVKNVRKIIGENYLQRIASTRMIIAATKLKEAGIKNWKEELLIDWSPEELEILNSNLEELYKKEKEERKQRVAELIEKEVSKRMGNQAKEDTKDEPIEEVEEKREEAVPEKNNAAHKAAAIRGLMQQIMVGGEPGTGKTSNN